MFALLPTSLHHSTAMEDWEGGMGVAIEKIQFDFLIEKSLDSWLEKEKSNVVVKTCISIQMESQPGFQTKTGAESFSIE